MPRPLCTVICPSIGRPTLTRTLAAIRAQAGPAECEVLVVADTHAGTFTDALRPVPRLCRHYGARCEGYDGGAHCYGQPQRNYGMTQARGQWLLCGQDDSAWTAALRGLIEAGDLRHQLRQRWAKRVQAQYSLAANLGNWPTAWMELLDRFRRAEIGRRLLAGVR